MTLPSAANRNDYLGNGATSVYAYTFRIFANTDLLVTVRNLSNVETTLVLTTDYTVSGVGASSGGNVTLVNASQAWLDADGDLLTNFALTIRRVRPLTQTTDIRNQGDFFPEAYEDALDDGVMLAQQNDEALDRSLKLPETEAGTSASTTIPVSADRTSRVLAFDASGNPIAQSNVPTSGVTATAYAETILDDTTAAAARTTLVISAEVSPASIGSSQNNYAGVNVDGTIVLGRLTASTPVNVTGLTGGVVDKLLILTNIGTNAITLTNEDAASTAANRILTPGGGNLALSQNETAVLRYDNTSSRWRVVASPLIGTNQLEDNSVTFAKIQDIATARLLGRTTAGSGDPEEISVSVILSLTGGILSVAAGGITSTELGTGSVTNDETNVTMITGQTLEAAPASADEIVVHDATAGALRRMTLESIVNTTGAAIGWGGNIGGAGDDTASRYGRGDEAALAPTSLLGEIEVTRAGTIRNLRIQRATATAGGTTGRWTVRINNVASAVTCDIGPSGTS